VSEVWVTHPQLTPAHDFKCLRASLGTWLASGWQERADQSDPAEVDVPADPRLSVESPVESSPKSSASLPRKES